MSVSKKVAKSYLVYWAGWMNANSDRGASVGYSLGYSSDGKCSPAHLKTAGCRGSGLRTSGGVVVMPEDVEWVEKGLSKLDDADRLYADIFFRWKMAKQGGITECIEIYCKALNLTASQYKRLSHEFYIKICAVLG